MEDEFLLALRRMIDIEEALHEKPFSFYPRGGKCIYLFYLFNTQCSIGLLSSENL